MQSLITYRIQLNLNVIMLLMFLEIGQEKESNLMLLS